MATARQATMKTIEIAAAAIAAGAIVLGALRTWWTDEAVASISHTALERRVDDHVADRDNHFGREDAERLQRLDTRQEILIDDVDELQAGVQELLRRTR